MENIREIILDGLLALEKESIYSNKIISSILEKYDYLEQRDKAFMKRCFEGTIENRIFLDYRIDKLSSVPVRKMKPLIRSLMRMSAYQILLMDQIPDSAAINEAVKLAKKRGFSKLSGFVNAVLRNLSRTKEDAVLPDREKEPVRYLEVKYSCPEWLIKKWMGIYGLQKTEQIIDALLKVHPVSIRFDRRLEVEKRDSYAGQMAAAGITLRQDERLPYVYFAEDLGGIKNLPGFAEGAFIIQDVSSALAVEAAGIRPGDFVVDACAAPGGKTILAAEMAVTEDGRGLVVCGDVSESKIEKIEENVSRMKQPGIKARVFDATGTDEILIGKADVLILDVPCSGLGILGKKRDIKYNTSPENIEEIIGLQRKIVEASYPYLKEGGTLLYSTCTINPDENEKQVKYICENLPFEETGKMKQLLPDEDKCDGFFYAVLKRVSKAV